MFLGCASSTGWFNFIWLQVLFVIIVFVRGVRHIFSRFHRFQWSSQNSWPDGLARKTKHQVRPPGSATRDGHQVQLPGSALKVRAPGSTISRLGHHFRPLWMATTVHRGAFCQFPFRWIYYYGSNESTGKEIGKTHLCAVGCYGWHLKMHWHFQRPSSSSGITRKTHFSLL